ncbi:MAG: hypothetical protein APU95_03895 [Hadesarchaea archaeon YNP_N21]|nr:MAG: hypothetical protein APU95_03895 [Hadesarchaea archaeon YNP_N21]
MLEAEYIESGRKYPKRPMAGVGALITRDGKVLLIKRRYEPGEGKWSIPGGLIELGERAEEAVKREVKEEIGLEVEVERLIDSADIIVREGERIKYHFVLLGFLCKPTSGNLKPNQEVMDVGWFSSDELMDLDITRTAKDILQKVGILQQEDD